MCDFPYLAVVLTPEFRPHGLRDEDIRRVCTHHGFQAHRLLPAAASFLASFAESASCVCTFTLSEGCACGWTEREHAQLRALACSLLDARDVMRVRFGVWSIRGDVREGEPHQVPATLALDRNALQRERAASGSVIHLRRVDAGPHPRIRLKDLLPG